MTVDQIIDGLLKKEGGFVDHKDDRGGATNWGITEAVARANGWTGLMRGMPESVARDIYRRKYIEWPGFHMILPLSPAIAAEVIDTGINMGPRVATRFLQRALNALNRQQVDYADIAMDGLCGPATVRALAAFLARRRDGERVMLIALNALQGARYVELAEGRAANESFLNGWLANRVALT